MSPACDACGTHVSENYWRVFSYDGVLASCQHCTNKDARADPDREQMRETGAEPEPEPGGRTDGTVVPSPAVSERGAARDAARAGDVTGTPGRAQNG